MKILDPRHQLGRRRHPGPPRIARRSLQISRRTHQHPRSPYVADIYRGQGVSDELIAYDPIGEHRGWSGRRRNSLRTCAPTLRCRACYCRTPSTPLGSPGAPKFPNASATPAMLAAFSSPKPSPSPSPAKFRPTKSFTTSNSFVAPAGSTPLPQVDHIAFASFRFRQPPRRANSDRRWRTPTRSPHRHRCRRILRFRQMLAPERFAEWANRFLAHHDADVILFGTAAEAPVSNAIIANMHRKPIDLTGKTVIADLPALLSQCHLFLGNDSGAMHVAAAVGLPVVAVFGPTDPLGTAPVTPRCAIVQQKPYCSPCFLRRCPTDHRCMKQVTPAMVEAAVNSWLTILPT